MRSGSDTGRPSGPPTAGYSAHGQPSHAVAAGALPQASDTGQLFRELRKCLRLPLPELARRLETRIDVITALESGDVTQLPPWPETVRVVSAYTLLVRIDPRPVLSVLSEKIAAETTARSVRSQGKPSGKTSRSPVRSAAPPVASLLAGPMGQVSAFASHFGGLMPLPRRGTRILSWVAGVTVLSLILLLTVVPSKMQQASATGTGLFGGLQSLIAGTKVKVSNGLTWIETDDPRSRKSDKLHSPKR